MKKVIVLNLLLVFLFSCSSVKVVETNQESDFSLANYETFGFYKIRAEITDAEYKERIEWIKEAISNKMSTFGLSRDLSDPDLLVNIGIVVEEKVQTRQTDFRTDAPMYMGQRRYSWKSEEVEVGRYDEGTVTVDFVDKADNELVWQGVARSVVKKSENKSQKNIRTGADKLFASIKR